MPRELTKTEGLVILLESLILASLVFVISGQYHARAVARLQIEYTALMVGAQQPQHRSNSGS